LPLQRDTLIYTSPTVLATPGFSSPAATRHHALTFQDPVHRVDIRGYVREKLDTVVQRCGGMDAFREAWVMNVDQDVLKGFGELGVF